MKKVVFVVMAMAFAAGCGDFDPMGTKIKPYKAGDKVVDVDPTSTSTSTRTEPSQPSEVKYTEEAGFAVNAGNSAQFGGKTPEEFLKQHVRSASRADAANTAALFGGKTPMQFTEHVLSKVETPKFVEGAGKLEGYTVAELDERYVLNEGKTEDVVIGCDDGEYLQAIRFKIKNGLVMAFNSDCKKLDVAPAKKVGVNDACENSEQCEEGAACHETRKICLSVCEAHSDCSSEGYCGGGYCWKRRDEGQMCWANARTCKEGLICNTDKKCAKPSIKKNEGEACGNDSDECVEGFFCGPRHTCIKPTGQLNEPCTGDSSCQGDWVCVDGACVVDPSKNP